MSQLTAFGKVIRKLRIDKGYSMMEMADALSVSAAFCSSTETGRKNPPEAYVNQVADFLMLDGKGKARLHQLALQSKSVIKLRPKPASQELVAEFARKFESLAQDQVDEMFNILKKVKVR